LFDQKHYEKFDGNTEVVATIVNFETGNDSITGRQPTDGPQRLRSYGMRAIIQPFIGWLSAGNN
jgi:hypothetical protein